MHFPTWVDLKGEDSVPETVHHVVVPVNPKQDRLWERLAKNHIQVRLGGAGGAEGRRIRSQFESQTLGCT